MVMPSKFRDIGDLFSSFLSEGAPFYHSFFLTLSMFI